MGVDQSVLLLKKGNDIEQSTVFSELDKYGSVDKYNYEWYPNYDYSRNYEDFTNADSVIITNAKKEFSESFLELNYNFVIFNWLGRQYIEQSYEDEENSWRSDGVVLYNVMPQSKIMNAERRTGVGLIAQSPPEIMFDSVSLKSAARGGQSIAPKPIEIRKEFPETWLFDNLEFSR